MGSLAQPLAPPAGPTVLPARPRVHVFAKKDTVAAPLAPARSTARITVQSAVQLRFVLNASPGFGSMATPVTQVSVCLIATYAQERTDAQLARVGTLLRAEIALSLAAKHALAQLAPSVRMVISPTQPHPQRVL